MPRNNYLGKHQNQNLQKNNKSKTEVVKENTKIIHPKALVLCRKN